MLLVAAFAGASCEETNGDPPGPSPPVAIPQTPQALSIELGAGDTAFEPLDDKGTVALFFGPQGGFHIWTAVRVRDGSFVRGHVNLRAVHKGGSLAGLPASEAPRWTRTAEGFAEAAGLRTFVSDTFPAGTELTLRAEVLAVDGRHGAVERSVVVR